MRQPAHGTAGEQKMRGERPGIPGCGVTAHIVLLIDMSIASRLADIVSRMA